MSLNERVDFLFRKADINDSVFSVEGWGSDIDRSLPANSSDGFKAATTAVPAAAPRNFLRLAFGIALLFHPEGFRRLLLLPNESNLPETGVDQGGWFALI
ncbi:MAG: hypothetical protein MI863_15830 [Desulfobacterales bacterium]|nr:hypothetical protein [Desulfobacterales bacterium]